MSQVEICFFGWGERKGITNPWIKSADIFKLKRNGSNHLESHNSFEGTAWPNFRQKDPLEILRDMECQANHFRKIFKQGPVPVSDSVSHRFCVCCFFLFSSQNVRSQRKCRKLQQKWKELGNFFITVVCGFFHGKILHFSAKFNALILFQES